MSRFKVEFFFSMVTISLLLYTSIGYPKSLPLPGACMTQCRTPFGQVLGVGTGDVPAYSNCNAKCVNPAPDKKDGTYTGIKWQCVEYARRWLLVNKGEVYGDIDIAADIWGLKYVTRVKDKAKFRMINYPNGNTTKPVVGDLLIYAKAYLKTGHIAVISKVDSTMHTIDVQEQNFNNAKWPGNYARSITYIKRQGHYWVLDAYLLGWKHITDQPFVSALK